MFKNKGMQFFIEKKKGQKNFDLPEWGFEPRIFEQIPAQNLNFEGD